MYSVHVCTVHTQPPAKWKLKDSRGVFTYNNTTPYPYMRWICGVRGKVGAHAHTLHKIVGFSV